MPPLARARRLVRVQPQRQAQLTLRQVSPNTQAQSTTTPSTTAGSNLNEVSPTSSGQSEPPSMMHLASVFLNTLLSTSRASVWPSVRAASPIAPATEGCREQHGFPFMPLDCFRQAPEGGPNHRHGLKLQRNRASAQSATTRVAVPGRIKPPADIVPDLVGRQPALL